MKLPRAFTPKTGFSLIEMLLVLVILVLLAAVSLPLALNFYQNQQLEVKENEVVQALRKAQFRAMAGKEDSSFGVYFFSNKFILFKGASFLSRDSRFDEEFEMPKAISRSGLSEIVFSKLEGIPSLTGNIILSAGNRSETISINGIGTIDY